MEVQFLSDIDWSRKFKQDTVRRNVARNGWMIVQFIVSHFDRQGERKPHGTPDFFQKGAPSRLAHFLGRIRLGDLRHAISFVR
jgi:hypothetical protein